MKNTKLKIDFLSWLYRLVKLTLILSFFIPIFLWIEHIFGISKIREQTLTEKAFSSTSEILIREIHHLSQDNEGSSPRNRQSKTPDHPVVHPVEKDLEKDRIWGIDVSHYQGVINWKQVKKNNLQFAITKATGGEEFVDPRFHANWHGIRQSGLIRGAYHFFYPNDDPHTQAQHFLETIGTLKSTDLPPIVDIEITDHTKREELNERLLVWLEFVESSTQRLPIIYTDTYFGTKYLTDSRLKKYPLWIAEYGPKIQSIPALWKDKGWSIWQYSETGQMEGIQGHVDKDTYEGDLESFQSFIKSTHL